MPQNAEGGRRPEGRPLPYYLAATFLTREQGQVPYNKAQEIIHLPANDVELSAFLFERKPSDPRQPPLPRPWFFVVLGERPSEPIEQQLREILGRGEMTVHPLENIVTLAKRRESETQKGSWVDEHHGEGCQVPGILDTKTG